MNTYPSPDYLLGALACDDAPDQLALNVADAYEDMRARGKAIELHEWCLATYGLLLERGYTTTAMAVIAQPSTHVNDLYLRRAREVRERVGKDT